MEKKHKNISKNNYSSLPAIGSWRLFFLQGPGGTADLHMRFFCFPHPISDISPMKCGIVENKAGTSTHSLAPGHKGNFVLYCSKVVSCPLKGLRKSRVGLGLGSLGRQSSTLN